jgi:transcriptional regulator
LRFAPSGLLAPRDAVGDPKRETMLASIRVIDLVVDEIEGQSKLNQHKSDEDHVAVANQLARAEETGSRRLAERMRALRPELGYDVEQ